LNKRDFIKALGVMTLSTPFLSYKGFDQSTDIDYSQRKSLSEENFWKSIRKDYLLKKDYVNLENGYYCFIPQPTLNKYLEHVKRINFEGSYYMRNQLDLDKRKTAERLSNLVNCDKDELAITRNTTESLDLIISGFPWKKNDEAIFAMQDYGSMQEMFKLTAKRRGIVNKIISVPNHPKNDEEIVSLYEKQITKKTKLIMVSHMINITGQILPVKKICEMAHSYNIDVLVDGAHCVGHIDVDIKDLNCDYYGSSLHKWLSAPLGTGLLFVKKEKISKIEPIFAGHVHQRDNIMRLNHIGTHPVHSDLAINDAIDYLESIGIERKQNRLRYIQRYWSDKLRFKNNIIINTPIEIQRSCGIANIGVKNKTPDELSKILFNEYSIFTVAIDYANVKGCRITPNIYTSEEELDYFVESIIKIASN
jgi:selenocysteine lyase/cysteine desulfurase